MIDATELIDPRAQEVAKRLEKRLGTGGVTVASDSIEYDRFTTGSLGLDIILNGGWVANQWHELIGEYSSGKTNLALATVAANQARDPRFTAVWVAAEGWSEDWAKSCGVDTSRVLLVNTNIMEDAYDAVEEFVDSHAIDCVVIDSYPALTPVMEMEKDSGEMAPGRGALLTNQFFRKIGKAMRRQLGEDERPLFGLMINQWRSKIGISFGDPRTTPGGKGKDFAMYTRLDLARDEWIEGGIGKDKERIGQVVRATTIKCKGAPQQRKAYYDIYFDEGGPIRPGQIDYVKEIVTHALLFDLLDKSGNWITYKDVKANGVKAFTDAVREQIDLKEALEKEVLRAVNGA